MKEQMDEVKQMHMHLTDAAISMMRKPRFRRNR
jgi:hypothetical protein